MAPLPKRRHSTRRGGKRKAAITPPGRSYGRCSHCGEIVQPHRVCRKCGYYKGKQIIEVKQKKIKKTS